MWPFNTPERDNQMQRRWAQNSVDQITSIEGLASQREFYNGIKGEFPELSALSIDTFQKECQGAQLELLGLATIFSNLSLADDVLMAIDQNIEAMEAGQRITIRLAYSSANNLVGSSGSRGLSGIRAIAVSFSERIGMSNNELFIRLVESEFEGLANIIITDIRQNF